MKKLAVIFGVVLVAGLISAGCGKGDEGSAANANAAPAGATKEAEPTKNGQPTAKGLSPNDLTPPPNGGEAQFGSKTGGK